jgi:hypothetical protein
LYADSLTANGLSSGRQENRTKNSHKKRDLLSGSRDRELPLQEFTGNKKKEGS